jgi:hypothetical protein
VGTSLPAAPPAIPGFGPPERRKRLAKPTPL